ncbi:energy-coupling factor ABC transporter ATP-binding protein [Thalassospira sp.]|uniref:energy-coupling factor ABC transporter ATP-binding protein n=1 Tax=Thalassospira sp. TaxID=1912094 RepID=UPI0027339E0A|nr:ABC transporter ATP-binding protein [Thalassospira sp.]MDP2698001.1 ABC transporter ATP-binding protein [Thalassospira sp.]
MAAAALIRMRNIHFSFVKERPVLRGANLDVFAGEKIALSGPNGAGKTTLIHAMMGLIRITSGEIDIFGKPCRNEDDFRAIRGRVGLLFQDSDDQLFCPTVLEDVAFGPLNLGHSPLDADQIARNILSKLGLEGFEDRITYQLSGGEKRLVALATVLAMEPEVLLLDEPTNGLDVHVEHRLTGILKNLPQAMVIISHDRNFLDQVATRTVKLSSGQITDQISKSGCTSRAKKQDTQ